MDARWKQNHPERAVTPSHTSRDQSGRQEAITETTNGFFLPLSWPESFTSKMDFLMELEAPENRAFIR